VVTLDDLPGWREDHLAEAVQAPSEAAARDWLRRRFVPVALPHLLYTGYFEITVAGARAPGGGFLTPVLRRPRDAGAYDRAAILGGALDGRGLELAWLRSPAELFFLQLQGSGRVALAEGGMLRLASAGSNGRPAVPTEVLFGSAADDLSIPGLRGWAARHPAQAAARIARDPSYVFFRPSNAGPVGSNGERLTPLRSLAVDPAVIALGSPVWIDGGGLRRLMFAQDTGAGIRGLHADIFFGAGPSAEDVGGHLHEVGRAWRLDSYE